MQTSSIRMRTLTESTQKQVDSLYKDINDCSDFRNIIPQKYESSKDWPGYLDMKFLRLIDNGHTPLDQCQQCNKDRNWILLQYNEYNDFIEKNSQYKGNM